MNRLISENLNDVTPENLPPRIREGPVRALFINSNALGLKTVAQQLKHYTASYPGIDAVHIDLIRPLWMKVFGKGLFVVPTRGWDFSTIRYLKMWDLVIQRWFCGPLDLRRFDLVQIMTQLNGLSLLRLPHAGHIKRVIKIDTTTASDIRDFGYSPIAVTPFLRSERRIFDAADLIVSNTIWSRESLRSDYGISDNRIHIATNAVSIPDRIRWSSDRPVDATPIRLAFVGNDWKRKGGHRILRIHQRSLADRVELHVIGRVPVADANANNVVWHGTVPRERLLNEMLPTMDMFVLASRMDMAPWASVEAAAAGLPLVVPRLDGFPEVVVDGETGLLFDTHDDADLERALIKLVDDHELRRRMGMAAHQHIKRHFNADVVFPAWLDRLVALVDEEVAL